MENKKYDVLSLLQSSFLFRGQNPQLVQNLANKAKIRIFPAKKMLFEEEFTSEYVYLILEGLAKVYRVTEDGKEISLSIDVPGNFLGILELEGRPNLANVQTLQKTIVLSLNKKDIMRTMEDNPILWEKAFTITRAKLQGTQKTTLTLLGKNLLDRTYTLLLFLSRFFTFGVIEISQETIASLVGATRPRVTETLHVLQNERKISIASKKITLLS